MDLEKVLKLVTSSLELTGPDLDGISLRTAQLIVWGVHNGRFDQVRVYCDARGLSFDSGELHALAALYRNVFRVDVDRQSQPNCFICDDPLLCGQEEVLCDCYLRAVEGTYVSPDMVTIEGLKRVYPNSWGTRLQATRVCVSCSKIFNVSVADVEKQLRAGKQWVAPKWCRTCYKPSTRPSHPPTSNRPHTHRNKQPAPSQRPESYLKLPVTGES